MKKLSFKSIVSLLLAFVLTFSVVYMPGMSLSASAACSGGCSFTAQKVGVKYLKSEKTCGKQAVYYYSCAVCGLSSGETNEAKTFTYGEKPEHNWGPTQTVPATCTAPESTERTCTRCGEKYVKKGSGEPLGHKEIYNSNNNGTHTKICTRAGCTLHEISDCSTAVLTCGVIPVCDKCNTPYGKTEGHELTDVSITKQPTCTEKGTALKKCARCDYTVTEEIDALGHDINILKVIKNATCEEEGKESVECKRCDFKEERVIPATGHAYKKTTFPVTCASDGYDLFQCQNCDHEYKDNWVTDRQHNYIKTIKEATCTSAGVIAYTCSVCGIAKDSVVISALGHDMTGFQVSKEPTCTEEGLLVDKCKRCARTVTETVPALGHSFTLYISNNNATCTQNATEWAVCDRGCGAKDIREIPNSALGHNYVGNLCTRCNAVKDEDSSVCKHTYPDNWTVIITPDCQNKGAQVKVCTLCKNIISESLPKTGHIDTDGDSKCDTCDKTIVVVDSDKTEEKPCDCNCHAGGIKAFFFKLVNFFAKIFDKSARVCQCGKSH